MTHTKTDEKNILYFQSGGPTAVINSSFNGLMKEAKKSHHTRLFVSSYGISGLINNQLHEVKKGEVPLLSYRPGSYWGSLRKKLPEDPNDPLAITIVQNLVKNHISYIFPNGGNDSMDTAFKLMSYIEANRLDIKVIGIPKTVDNDLPYTDHTPGFGSAAKYVANSVLAIALDDKSYEKGRINIVEVMGRDSGFLTASSLLASLRGQKPDFIYVPEVPFDVSSFLKKAEECYDRQGRCLVVVSEGIRDKENNLIAATGKVDAFGNRTMGGVANYLASLVEKDGYKTRGIELSVLQRAGSFIPSGNDIHEAEMCGRQALRFAKKGLSGYMVAMKRNEGEYGVTYEAVPLEKIDGKIVSLPSSFINKEGDNILPEYLEYVEPLIQGNRMPLDEDGLLNLY